MTSFRPLFSGRSMLLSRATRSKNKQTNKQASKQTNNRSGKGKTHVYSKTQKTSLKKRRHQSGLHSNIITFIINYNPTRKQLPNFSPNQNQFASTASTARVRPALHRGAGPAQLSVARVGVQGGHGPNVTGVLRGFPPLVSEETEKKTHETCERYEK